jgi:hypothetical protein
MNKEKEQKNFHQWTTNFFHESRWKKSTFGSADRRTPQRLLKYFEDRSGKKKEEVDQIFCWEETNFLGHSRKIP